ncbi:MAG TPA: UvrD-helicase domain-containing protein, partial [Geobacteraceae bacterium]
CRIAWLLQKLHVPPTAVLAVTFTNKAAREMRERMEEMVGRKGSDGVTVSTFHSLGVRILRREIHHAGYKGNFTIYSTSDQAGIIRQLYRELGVDAKKTDPDLVLWKISAAKNLLICPEHYQPRYGDPLELLTAQVYPRYQRTLKACNAVDFDDIIMLTVELLQGRPESLAHWQERFRYIMVDEYQDTNPSQYLLIHLLARGHRNLCVVGDDDQSIYGWRGADVEKILAFEHDYPGCKVVKLEQNYRSTATILEAANHVIRNNTRRKEKSLWTDAGPGRPIDLVVARDDEEESSGVVERIQVACFQHELSYGDFAILYRTNAQSRAFEEQLRFASIPYVLIGGMQFYERREVKDTLAYLKVLDNPADEQALLRIVNFPRRGIGESSMAKISAWSLANGCSLFDACGRVEEIPGLSAPAREQVFYFHRLLRDEVSRFRTGGGLASKAGELFKRLGIEEELYRTVDDPAAARRKVENVGEIVNSLAAYEEKSRGATLAGFLEKVSLMDEDRFGNKERPGERDAVVLMSLHSSKGLEFPHVFLVGLEEGVLPHKRSVEEDGTIDEERRLCYVGMTRAR